MPPQLEKNHVVPTAWQDEALARDSAGCQVPRTPEELAWAPSPGDLPDPGIEPMSLASPALQADSLPTEPPVKLATSQKECS